MTLSPRLKAIYDLIPKGDTFADIGTDHGYLAAELLRTKSPFGIPADINVKPLQKAIGFLEKCGLSQKADCRLGSGLSVLSPGEVDTIVIAGMGGYLIADLLEAEMEVAHGTDKLILQPMNNTAVLRNYLQNNHFKIISEVMVREDDLFYQIMVAQTGEMMPLSALEAMMGIRSLRTIDDIYIAYLELMLRKTEKTLRKVSEKNTPNAMARAEECQQLMISLKQALEECVLNNKRGGFVCEKINDRE